MTMETLPRHVVAGLLIGVVIATAAEGQVSYPHIAGPHVNAYIDGWWYYSPKFHDYPGSLYDTTPHPPMGGYLPNLPRPYLPQTVPPGGHLRQPYPYVYQPPLYVPQSYVRPYYPPNVAPPYYYRYRRPYEYPWFTPRPDCRYRVTPEQRRNVAPVGSEPALEQGVGPSQDVVDRGNPRTGSAADTP